MPGPWEKYQTQASSGPWDKYKAPGSGVPTGRSKPTSLEASLRAGAQGYLSGLPDEIVGSLGAAADVALGPYKLTEFQDRYRSRTDDYRAKDELARQTHPNLYSGVEIASSLVGPNPFSKIKAISKLGKLGSSVVQGVGSGALQGLGTSTSSDTSDVLEDVKTGATYGGVTGGAFNLGVRAIKSLNPSNVAKKLSNVFLNTPEEITETYIKNPQGVLNAPKRHELAKEYQGLLDKLKQETIEGSGKSREILKNEGLRFSGDDLADVLDKRADDIAARTEGVWDDPELLAAHKWLKDKAQLYRGKDVSANRVKDTLQGIDRSTEFEVSPGKFSKISDLVKKGSRSDIDELLKSKSPAYRDMMKQVSADTALLDEASSIAASPQGLANVFRRIETDQYGGGQVPRDVLERFGQRVGSDVLEKAKLSTAREAFDKSLTQGSRNVQMFSNLGKDIPGLKYIMPIIGGSVDKYGRKMTMGAVDTAVKLNKVLQSEGPQKFAKDIRPIIEAAKKGNPAAALTFQLLSQSNPEALKDLDTGEPLQ